MFCAHMWLHRPDLVWSLPAPHPPMSWMAVLGLGEQAATTATSTRHFVKVWSHFASNKQELKKLLQLHLAWTLNKLTAVHFRLGEAGLNLTWVNSPPLGVEMFIFLRYWPINTGRVMREWVVMSWVMLWFLRHSLRTLIVKLERKSLIYYDPCGTICKDIRVK